MPGPLHGRQDQWWGHGSLLPGLLESPGRSPQGEKGVNHGQQLERTQEQSVGTFWSQGG